MGSSLAPIEAGAGEAAAQGAGRLDVDAKGFEGFDSCDGHFVGIVVLRCG